ncbi:MAG: tRNA dihydrouridine synthase DusB [Candidatus Omnitrophota bacterium]|jgi:nifR3 family TIM-barrel protein
MLKFGNVKIDTNIFLAPLSGCSDLPFRLICREHGAKFCFYEMTECNSIMHPRKKTCEILKTHKDDTPVAAQLLGSDPVLMLDAAQKLLEMVKVPFLDINCACPAKKVTSKKAGVYMMRDTARMLKIVSTLSSKLPIPVTVKIRIGVDRKDPEGLLDTVRKTVDNGAAAIFVHGRTGAQGYSGDVDYEAIRSIKDAVNIPVIGVGNILSPALAKKMLDETGCDGICIARGAFGNPWIFKDTEEYLKNGTLISSGMNIHAKKEVIKKHLAYIEDLKEIRAASKTGFMRKVTLWYIKAFPRAARLREIICKARNYEEIVKLVDSLPLSA